MKIIIALLLSCIALNAFSGVKEGIQAYQQGQYTIAFGHFERAAKSKEAAGQHMLASLYYQGKGTNQDLAKAAKLFKLAAEQGYLPSISNLGIMYMSGVGVPQSYSEAYKYFLKAAESGDLQSTFNIGQFYRIGNGVNKNNEKAAYWYKIAAENGSILAQNEYGLLFAQGHGVQQDYIKAYAWINLAAEAGDKQAIKNKARLLKLLKPEDKMKAMELASVYKANYSAAK